ncbi:MAG: tRNA (guanosine(46)-N7)-methyltransferase TrmB [Candidatus Kerfeldbacteria bacterium]|nr:tRNA (guanosine(46)-N7)-methyltransferase TrmB [Candidatus Kerfeldbacteria bacterium]
MARKKLSKFAELVTLPHLLEKPVGQAGRWPQPLVLELGCGYGEYTLALAQRQPQCHYVGMDIQGERLWRGAKAMQALKLENVWWLRGYIDHLLDYFAPGEVAEIWLTFPDPFAREGHAKKRLTAPRFLDYYKTILVPGGRVHLKTDSANLVAYSIETIQTSGGMIDEHIPVAPIDIMTRFEQKHRQRGDQIQQLSWHWPTIQPI